MQLPIEFVEGRPASVVFPDFIEVAIADTAPPSHGQSDSNWKPARLGNQVQKMLPPFVKTGDVICLMSLEPEIHGSHKSKRLVAFAQRRLAPKEPRADAGRL
jgi:hypothetical protein